MTDGRSVAPLPNSMTGEQLLRLYENPFYLQAYEFFLNESTRLSEILEEMGCDPVTPEQRRTVRVQCQKTKEARIVLQQFQDLMLSNEERSSQPMSNHVVERPFAG
jgi:hypothetical protein